MNALVQIFKALSDSNRLRIVGALLEHQELCACQLTELLQVAGATASRHLAILTASGLIESRKDGRWVYYRPCRSKSDLKVLIDWIEEKTNRDPFTTSDTNTLKEILSYPPEYLCRKQRGEKCCPEKSALTL